MDKQDDENSTNSLKESRKILKPYRHLFSKPITVKRNEHSKALFDIEDKNIVSSCTQTSKTILELAKLERKNARDRSISPDSLCTSPKKVDDFQVNSSPESDAETIALMKKESAYDLLHEKSAGQQYIQLKNIPLTTMDQYYDDFDEYTPDGSVYIPQENCNTVTRNQHQYNQKPIIHSSSQNPLQSSSRQPIRINIAAKSNISAPYPPLYNREYIVANAHINHSNQNYHQLNHELNTNNAHAYHGEVQTQRVVMVPKVIPDSNATATAYLIQQQQVQHKLADSVFPSNSLVNTFLARSKNRVRYTGDQTDCRSKQCAENHNQHQNSYRFKSHSYIDPPSAPNDISCNKPQNYQNRSKFTINELPNQHLYHPQYPNSHNQHPLPNNFHDNNPQMLMEDDMYTNCIHPKNSVNCGSKAVFGQRRSNSFMMPTIASERRSCMHEVRQITRLLSPTIRGCSLSPRANNNHSTPLCNAQTRVNGQHQQEQQYQQERQYYQYQQQMQNQHKVAVQNQHKIKVPYIDGSICDDDTVGEQRNKIYKEKIRDYSPVNLRPISPKNNFEEDLLKLDQLSLDVKNSVGGNSTVRSNSGSLSIDTAINNVLNRIKHEDWNIALKGLAEATELCRSTDASVMAPHMTPVNQRLLALLRSPRSHVCRTACQAAGHLFESMKDTRKPEFEDIVNTLLHKTADSNKFIRQDANLALDCMVTHISSFHAIKALCGKGPAHKNPLVRCATIRLIICAVVIAGPESILNPTNTDFTRKRLIVHLAKFVMDKNLETRRYAERLFKVLNKERSFDTYVKKFLEKEDLESFKQNIKYLKK